MFAEAVQIPVVTTLMAKGAFPDSHPLCVGLPGMHGSKFANWAMNRADLLVTIGARFDDRVTGKLDAFAPGAKVIHMDIDPAEISKNRHADIPIVGGLKQVLPALTEAYLEMRAQDRIASKREWKDQVEEWRFKHPFRYRRVGPLKTQYVMERFRDLLADRDVIWTTGVGQHQMWAAQWLKIEKPRHWITSGGLGTMGFGVPAAIGAQMAFPDKTVVNIDGDGCFQMTMQELATAVSYDVPGHPRDPQQRLARHGAPVAAAVPRRALLRDAAAQRPARLREAGRVVRRARPAGRDRGRGRPRDHGGRRVAPAVRDRLPGRPRGEGLPDGAVGLRLERDDRRAVGQRVGRGGRLMHHTLSVLVENSPGVLARVAGLFSRRGFNIESLAVGPTEQEDRSRITLRVDASQHSIDQVIKQLYKLINVLKVNEMTSDDAIEREMMIVRVTAAAGRARRPDPPRRGVLAPASATSAPPR